MAVLDDALALADNIGTALKTLDTLNGEIAPGAVGSGLLEDMRAELRLSQSNARALVVALGGNP